MCKSEVELAQVSGRPLLEKATFMSLEDLCVLAESLFARNDDKDLKDWTIFPFQWSLVDVAQMLTTSRSIECGRWDRAYSRKTTRLEHSVPMFSTALKWHFDLHHSLACVNRCRYVFSVSTHSVQAARQRLNPHRPYFELVGRDSRLLINDVHWTLALQQVRCCGVCSVQTKIEHEQPHAQRSLDDWWI